MKYEWFLGGKNMFWMTIVLIFMLIFGFVVTYIIDPTTVLYVKIQKNMDVNSIKGISENYVDTLGIIIDKPVIYRFVDYRWDNGFDADPEEEITLGTFHEWNGKYYIDISKDLYESGLLSQIVVHETRHMIVRYLYEKKIINLSKYSEDIARGIDSNYDGLFNNAVILLKKAQIK